MIEAQFNSFNIHNTFLFDDILSIKRFDIQATIINKSYFRIRYNKTHLLVHITSISLGSSSQKYQVMNDFHIEFL
jgi:hypothetical protein